MDLGGDADTQACIADAIAEAFYGGVPLPIVREVAKRLPPDLLAILKRAVERAGGEPARAAAGLEHGTYVLDFGGRGFGAADGRMAGVIADSIRGGRLVVADVPTTLAASMRAPMGEALRTYRDFEHAIRYADMLAAQSVPR